MAATYSFIDVNAVLTGPGGSINLGYGAAVADEGFTIEFVDDKNTMTPAADGAIMHSLHASKAAMLTVRVLKTSKANSMSTTISSQMMTMKTQNLSSFRRQKKQPIS